MTCINRHLPHLRIFLFSLMFEISLPWLPWYRIRYGKQTNDDIGLFCHESFISDVPPSRAALYNVYFLLVGETVHHYTHEMLKYCSLDSGLCADMKTILAFSKDQKAIIRFRKWRMSEISIVKACLCQRSDWVFGTISEQCRYEYMSADTFWVDEQYISLLPAMSVNGCESRTGSPIWPVSKLVFDSVLYIGCVTKCT